MMASLGKGHIPSWFRVSSAVRVSEGSSSQELWGDVKRAEMSKSNCQ